MTSTEESWTSWLCDLEAEDYGFIDGSLPSHHDAPPKPQENSNAQRSFSTDSSMSNNNNSSGDDISCSFERPSKTLKTSTSNNSANTGYLPKKKDSAPFSYILSFNNASPAPMLNNIDSVLRPKGGNNNNNKVVMNNHGRPLPEKKEPKRSVLKTGSAGRSPQHAHDHIIAERMRREKISQQFIALSALIPGLKKMDKATVLGNAIKYVKQLQEQAKLMEEQSKRKSVESVVYVEKSQPAAEEDVSDTSSNSGDGNSYDVSKISRSLPEVEARVSEKNVLIRIHCEKQKGVLMYVLTEIEKLHLSVINSSTLPFGTSILDITITAEMDNELSLSVKELAKNLRVGLLQFTGVWCR